MTASGKFFALGAAFVLPLIFLSSQWDLTIYFAIAGLSCLAGSRIPVRPRFLAAAGFALIALACAFYLWLPDVPLIAGAVMGVGSSAANVAILDDAAPTSHLRKLLQLQAFMAAGNATPPLLAATGLHVSVLAACVGILTAVIAVSSLIGSGSPAFAPNASGANLRLATCSGLATAAQLGVLLAAQQLVQSTDLATAVWIGASFGIVAGRGAAAMLGERLTWRAAAAFALAYALLIQFFPVVAGGMGVAVLAFVSSLCIGPVFPLVLATAYSHGGADAGRGASRSGPLALAISIGMSGVVPLVLGASDGRWASIVLSTAGLLLAGLLFRFPQKELNVRQQPSAAEVDN